jgi:hypothetical protein
MKNIHVLPTDKPSRLHYFTANKAGYYLYPNNGLVIPRNPNCINQNIYITSDEDLMIGDYYIAGVDIYQCLSSIELEDLSIDSYCKKIILTTDPELIKDGVQAIDDEFLEWFVKNPSCKGVEIADLWKDGNPSTHFINGAKWQQEKSYSEEDMAEAFMACWKANVSDGIECKLSFKEWFEQFKKK